MILLSGIDMYHPAAISAEIARLNPRIEVIPDWKTPETAKEGIRSSAWLMERRAIPMTVDLHRDVDLPEHDGRAV